MIGIDPLKLISTFSKGIFTVGKKVGDKGFKIAANASDKLVDGTVNEFKNSLKHGAKNIKDKTVAGSIKGVMNVGPEAEFIGNSALYAKAVAMGDAPLTSSIFGNNSSITKMAKKTALLKRTDENLIGVKSTGLGKGLLIAGGLAVGTKEGIQDFSKSRVGVNDGRTYNNAPLINGQTFSALGASYADNAGATGDLGFALHNQRHSGLF